MPHRFRSNLSRDIVDLEPAFRHAVPVESSDPNAHTVLCDPSLFSGCGYATHDEAGILAAIAGATFQIPRLRDRRWLEIGSHTGWTAAHIALSGHGVLALEPEYRWVGHNDTKSPAAFYNRAVENLCNAGLRSHVALVGMPSTHLLETPGMYALPEHAFAGVFIDGNHSSPFPLEDAKIAERFVDYDGVVVFHDVIGEPIQEGVRYLLGRGWCLRLYRTPQVLACLWRPTSPFVPPVHEADPYYLFANRGNPGLNYLATREAPEKNP